MSRPSRSTLSEFLGDAVIYRSLVPLDPRLPSYADVAPAIGLCPRHPPRKEEATYGQAVARLLVEIAMRCDRAQPIERIGFLGDAGERDAAAFARICAAGGWRGMAFIGRDVPDAPSGWREDDGRKRTVLFATRWALLDELDVFCRQRRFAVDERTVLIVDLDKTAIGGRGRNDEAIDRARIDAIHRTLGVELGGSRSWESCRELHRRLSRPGLYPLTGDNQDVVAYLCLAAAGGWLPEGLLEGAPSGSLPASLVEVVAAIDRRIDRRRRRALAVHREVREAVRRGTPPSYASFRCREYEATLRRMTAENAREGALPDLEDQVVITGEVRATALRWRNRGALVLGISDKPDAAGVPTPERAEAGARPLHRTEARVIAACDLHLPLRGEFLHAQ